MLWTLDGPSILRRNRSLLSRVPLVIIGTQFPQTPMKNPAPAEQLFKAFCETSFGVLDESGIVIPCPDLLQWADWMEAGYKDGSNWIGRDDIQGFRISTVFSGINRNLTADRPAQWFETAVFQSTADGAFSSDIIYRQFSYPTRAEAIAGHAVICEKVRSGEIGDL